MAVKRIVWNVETQDIDRATLFYRDILGLEVLMDQGWILTLGNDERQQVQLSLATEGGSGTPVPDVSIEVDNFNDILKRMRDADFTITYGPVDEPWGVRRFFVRDPFGKLVNILTHI